MAGTPIDDARIALIRQRAAMPGATIAGVARDLGHDRVTVRRYWPEGDEGEGVSYASPSPIHGVAERLEARPLAEKVAILRASRGEADPGESIEALVERAVAAKLARMGGYAPEPEPEPAPVVPDVPPPLPPPGRSTVVRDTLAPERTLFLSDLHCPFHDPTAWRAVLALIADYRPQLVILGGDLFDCYAISSHDKDPGRADQLQDEFDAAQPLWAELEDASKDAHKVLFKGNHEERIDRLQREKPGLFRLRALELHRAAEMPGHWSYYPNQTRYKLGSLSCLHGDLKGRGTSSVHAASGMLRKLRTSCIFGHLHRFQTFYETNADGTVRAAFANAHLCDVEQARYIASPDWQQGVSTIDYDWSRDIFSVQQHMIINGAMRRGGTTYAPRPLDP